MITQQPRFLAYFVCAISIPLGLEGLLRDDSTAAAQFQTTGIPALPGYLVAAKDRVSGLTFTRITKPGNLGEGITCGGDYCSHRYSSAQAWNSDQTLLLIANGCGGLCFFDGHTYSPLFFRARSGNCEWHPRNPEQMICVGDRDIRLWTPRTDTDSVLFKTTDYKNLQLGPGKGNPSRDGQRIAVRAMTNLGAMVAFVFDIGRRVKYPDIELSSLPGTNGYCTIAPLGEKVVCFQSLPEGNQQTFIFGADGKLLQSWLENHRPGHGDMTVDSDGSEFMVGISKSPPDKYQVIKRRLDDGTVTPLTSYGEATHVSMRAANREGWAFVSYEGDSSEVAKHPGWAPYSRQIIALPLGGGEDVRRIAETYNVKSDYHSEAHGSPSPDGSQIIWSSNWGQPGGPVYEFVTRIPWLAD
jgi:hypothetical protein